METDNFSQEQTSSSKTPEKRLDSHPDVNWSEYAMDEAITTVVSNALPINALSTNTSLAVKSKRKSNKAKKLADNIVIDTEPSASMAAIPSLFEGQVPPDVVVVSSWNQEVEVVTSDPSDWGKVGEQMVSMSEKGRNLESQVKDTSTINTDELNSGRRSHWTIDDMANAINAVNNAKMSVSMAASFYRVPFWSLRDRLRGKVKIAGNTSVELPKPRKKNSRWTSWSQKDLEKAISDVKEGGMSVRKAALLHGIPKSSLGDRLTGKRQLIRTEDSYESETVAQLDLQGSPSFIGRKKGKKKLKKKSPGGDVTEMPDVTVLSPSLDLVHQNTFFPTDLHDGDHRGELEGPVRVHIVHEYNEADGATMGLFENQGIVALNEGTNEKDAKEEKEENTDSQRFDLEQKESKVSLENQNIGYENGRGVAGRDERVSGIGMKSAKKRKREEWQGRITMTNDVTGGKSSLKTRIKGWEQKDMENAIRDVTENGVSIRKAAVTYGIPKSSLGDRLTRIKYITDFGSLFDELKPLNVDKEEILKDLENGKLTPKAMAKHFGISFSRFKGIISSKNITEKNVIVDRVSGTDDGQAGELASSLEERGDSFCREEDSPIEVGKGQSKLTLKAKCQGESSKQLLDRKIKKERMCWERANLELAIAAVREGRLSLRGAAKSYGIPKSTLGDVLRGKSSVGQTPGPKRLLTEEEENSLAGWLITMGRSGRHVKINEILETVKAILDKSGKSVPRLKNNLPKQSWWYGFLLRHKEVAKVRNQLKEEASRKIGAHFNVQQSQSQGNFGKHAKSTILNKRAVKLELFTSDAKLSPSKGMEERADGNDNICSICSKAELSVAGEEIWISCGTVKDDGSLKDGCGGWSHLDCSNLGQRNLTVNELERVTWHCPKCV